MSDTTGELALKLAIDGDDTADYLTIDLRNSLNVLDGVFSSSTGHNHNGAHQGGNLSFGVLNTTSIAFANGATLGPFATGNQLRFQSTNVSFSGANTVDGTSTHTGASTFGSTAGVTGLLSANGGLATTNATISGTLGVTGATTLGVLTVSGALNTAAITTTGAVTAPDLTATTGWHRNNAVGTGLFNNALGIGLRFDSGRAGPIMHGGAYDAARVHGTPHVRVGYFTTPAVAANSEVTVSVTFSPAFPAGASPVALLTLLRNVADSMLWRVGLEFGQTTNTGFTARARNDNPTTQGVSVAFLAYWNE